MHGSRPGLVTTFLRIVGQRVELLSPVSVVPERVSDDARDRRTPPPGAGAVASDRGGLAASGGHDECVPPVLCDGRHRRRLPPGRGLRLLAGHGRGASGRTRRPGGRASPEGGEEHSRVAPQARAPLARGLGGGGEGVPESVRGRWNAGATCPRADRSSAGVVADEGASRRSATPAAENSGGLPDAGPDPLRHP